jgi:peptide-methionine (R)-S-oxide reductase
VYDSPQIIIDYNVGPASQGQDMTTITKPDAEWRKQLSPEAYHITREHGTERAGTSPLNAEKRDGMFMCVCCGAALFPSDTKFESGKGWPSFYEPVAPEAIGTTTDKKLFMTRTEVHCADCQAHLGHVFPDGPKPTGLRYCINGVALEFIAEDEDE